MHNNNRAKAKSRRPVLNNMPIEVLTTITEHLNFKNRRSQAQASRAMRNNVCLTCKSGLDRAGNLGITATASDGEGTYSLELWLMFEHWNDKARPSANRKYYRRFMGLGRVTFGDEEVAEVVVELLPATRRQPFETSLAFSPRDSMPATVLECFATCIVRHLRLRRKRIMDYIRAARDEIEIGPTRMSNLNAALANVRVRERDVPAYYERENPYVFWKYWREE